jgi:D-beta-D-heptose 7-phosphate kinase/D-beta-D-heptose 1-phosphate adenosyltransferase
VDEESVSPIDDDVASDVLKAQGKCLESADLLLIQDMAKGLFSPTLLQQTIRLWKDAGKTVVVDPRRAEDYGCYSGVDCLLPNRMEAELATGMRLAREDHYAEAARKILAESEVGAVVITLDREGMYFATADGQSRLIPTVPRSVVDVTGAGDMVSAMMSLSLASGVSFEDSVELANVAAGIEVSRQGAMPVLRAEVIAELESKASPAASKIRSMEELRHILDERRRRGETIAFTNGVFDLLHLGHVELIRYARSQADCLVVALNSDRSVRENKGPGRPINPEDVRAQTLAALPNVDYVLVFDEASVLSVVKELRPDVLVKGADYKSKQDVVGWDVVEAYGGKVMRAPLVKGLSTTEIIRRINGQPAEM